MRKYIVKLLLFLLALTSISIKAYCNIETAYTDFVYIDGNIGNTNDLDKNKDIDENRLVKNESSNIETENINTDKNISNKEEINNNINKEYKNSIINSKDNVNYKDTIENINLNNYNENVSYNGYTDTDIKLINDILNLYNNNKNTDSSSVEYKLDYIPSTDSYLRVISFLTIYYGIELTNDVHYNTYDIHVYGNDEATLTVYIDKIDEYNKTRISNTKKLKDIISKFKEGTEKEKVIQASKWIAENTTYTKNYYSVDELLSEGKGVCNSYALTLIRMCQLMGIKCDICFGYAKGLKHCWNKVTYSDGKVEYFDLTYYDSNANEKYLSMINTPHTILDINNYYYE